MNRIFYKYIFIFLYLSLLFRPVLPAIAQQLIKFSINANAPEHSFLVQQLLKHLESEKNEFSEVIQTSIESTSLFLPAIFIIPCTTPLLKIKNTIPVFDVFFVSERITSVFQPPEFFC